MNKVIVICVFSLFAHVVYSQINEHSYEDIALDLLNNGISKIKAEDLPESTRRGVIEVFRRRKYVDYLIRLRDEETINRIVNRYIELEGKAKFLKRRMADSRSPWLLPLLAPILDEDPTIEWRGYGEQGDDFGYPHTTADLMREIIHKSPEFSNEVRESFAYKGEDPWLLAGMRRWWAENADAVNNENYLEAKAFDHSDLMKRSPLELYGLEPASKPESTKTPSQKPGVSTSQSPQSENSSKQGEENIETIPPEHDRKIIFIVIAGTALLAVLFSYAITKRK